jgi:hypothetical protein
MRQERTAPSSQRGLFGGPRGTHHVDPATRGEESGRPGRLAIRQGLERGSSDQGQTIWCRPSRSRSGLRLLLVTTAGRAGARRGRVLRTCRGSSAGPARDDDAAVRVGRVRVQGPRHRGREVGRRQHLHPRARQTRGGAGCAPLLPARRVAAVGPVCTRPAFDQPSNHLTSGRIVAPDGRGRGAPSQRPTAPCDEWLARLAHHAVTMLP